MSSAQILTFEVAGRRFALEISDVREILRAVAVTPLPGAPVVVEGVIDLRGVLVPVLDLRRRLGLPRKPVVPSDHFIVTTAGARPAVLWVDRVLTLLEPPSGALDTAPDLTRAEFVAGIVKLQDGLVLIQDLLRFLSPAEEAALDESLQEFAAAKAIE